MRNKILIGLLCVVVAILAVFCVRAYQEKQYQDMVKRNVAQAEAKDAEQRKLEADRKQNAMIEVYTLRTKELCSYISSNLATLRTAKAPSLPTVCELKDSKDSLCPTATTIAIVGKCEAATF